MRAVIILMLLTLVLASCVTARIEESRTANTGIEADQALVILGRASYNDRETEESFTECLSDEGGQYSSR